MNQVVFDEHHGIAIRKAAFRSVAWLVTLIVVFSQGCSDQTDRSSSDAPSPPTVVLAGRPVDEVGDGNETSVQPSSSVVQSVIRPDLKKPRLDQAADALFQDWPTPQLLLVVTGNQDGYIEPCGCAGLDNQKGGLSRRQTLLKHLADRGWPVLPLDVGNQVRRFGMQPEVKFQATVDGFRKMKYGTVTFGPDDLRLSLGELLAAVAGPDDRSDLFVSANVDVLGVIPQFQIVRLGGRTIGITAVLGDVYREQLSVDEIEMSSWDVAIERVLPKLRAERCDVLVLLAHTTRDEATQIAQRFPQLDVVITAGGSSEPPWRSEPVEGAGTMIVQVGEKGMYTIVVGIYDDPDQPLRYQRVDLDKHWVDSKEMLELLSDYQHRLEALGLDGLQLRGVAHPSNNSFVGSVVCGECHTSAYEVWKETPHARATHALVHPEERSIPRHHDPECLSCHVTGWNPQRFFPYRSGYRALEASSHLHGNGCENCHGPGSAHVAAENGDVDVTDAQLAQLRDQMRLPLEEAERRCLECHDLDNDPDFHAEGAFEEYWKKIVHEGKY